MRGRWRWLFRQGAVLNLTADCPQLPVFPASNISHYTAFDLSLPGINIGSWAGVTWVAVRGAHCQVPRNPHDPQGLPARFKRRPTSLRVTHTHASVGCARTSLRGASAALQAPANKLPPSPGSC